jgi:predicted nuclease with RNAse H fold
MSDAPVYIGIDTTAGGRPITLAVLDNALRVRQLDALPLDAVVEAVLAYPTAVCGIDAPIGRNSGLLADPDYRVRRNLKPHRDRYSNYRVCEFELRRRGIYVYNTPSEESRVASWMQTSWQLYDRLRSAGYVDEPQRGPRRLFETYPYAIFTVLAGTRPYPKNSIEGRLQRQLILYEEGVDLYDPMRVLEEWTRHHLRAGRLNMEGIHEHDALDALAAAFTAYVLDREPQRTIAVGDPAEGQIVLPAPSLQDAY